MILQTINGRYGPCTYIKGDEYLGRSVFSYGEYNKEECETIVSLASDTVLDVGANIGNISQALEHSGFDVIAFEPQPAIYDCLTKNIKGKTYNSAVGSFNGEITMPKVDYSRKGNFGGISVGGNIGITVPMLTLDSLDLPKIGLIKIDVEGHEEEVLKGARNLILRDKPILYVEADRPEKLMSLNLYIRSLGYTIEPHNPPLFSPDNFFNNKKNIWDKYYVSKNWICRANS
jgi:FkbM family methyltransferase